MMMSMKAMVTPMAMRQPRATPKPRRRLARGDSSGTAEVGGVAGAEVAAEGSAVRVVALTRGGVGAGTTGASVPGAALAGIRGAAAAGAGAPAGARGGVPGGVVRPRKVKRRGV